MASILLYLLPLVPILLILLIIMAARSWNIPIVVLRFTGNKERPTVLLRKGRKIIRGGVPYLKVRGYKTEIRDFKSEFYYPAHKTKFGALILWEFEDQWLTPTIPKRLKTDETTQKRILAAFQELQNLQAIGFEFDDEMHRKLKLKIVDDVDAEFALQQTLRQDGQYSGGLLDFLNRHSTGILAVLIVALVLVGFIVWLDKMPDFAGQCAAAGYDSLRESGILERAAERITPPA